MSFIKNNQNIYRSRYLFKRRLAILSGLISIAFLVIIGRFLYLQIFKYDFYKDLSENNRIAVIPNVPNRGLILDRNGVIMADNYFVYSLEITPSKVPNLNKTIDYLKPIVEFTASDLKKFRKILKESSFLDSIPIKTHLSETEAAKFAANKLRFEGVEIKSRLFRRYPKGAFASHLIGHINRINEEDKEVIKKLGWQINYKGTDSIGKLGIEKYYEARLHGTTGFQEIEINANGNSVRILNSSPSIEGDTITLSIDSNLQEIAENAFNKHRGALVALNPKNGEVLAFVSRPNFDPNQFVGGIDADEWRVLNESLDKPMLNRTINGLYPPGSTIKPFIALAALENDIRKPPFTIKDPGFFTLTNSGHTSYKDWKPFGHGIVDIVMAITISCDTFFYGLGIELGINKLSEFLSQFGFGKLTHIDMFGENAGILPSPEWKQKRFKQPWYLGETVITSIGQGYTLVTPMQLALAVAILANDGRMIQPRLIQSIKNSQTGKIETFKNKTIQELHFKPENLALVKEGMINVTQPGGTAESVGAGAPYKIAAKTGTAQVVQMKANQKYNPNHVNEKHRDHALFIAYAPIEDPTIAIAVIVENGGHGGSTAGPIARKLMDYYLLKKISLNKEEDKSGPLKSEYHD
jgi:penicillin-binding protein 2